MTTANTNVSAYNSLFAPVYERALLVARAECVMAALVTPYSDKTDTASRIFSQREQATASKVAEGTDFQAPDRMGKAQIASLTPSEAMSQVVISDRAVRQDEGVIDDKTNEMGAAFAEMIDRDLISTFASLTGGETGTIGGTGVTPTFGHLLAAQTQLWKKNVRGRFNVVLQPYVMHAIQRSVDLTKNLASTPDSVKNGLADHMWLGSYENMDFYVSNNIDVDGNGDALGAMFTEAAIALDTRVAPHGLPTEYDASARETEFNLYADYGFGVRRANYGVQLKFAAATPTN